MTEALSFALPLRLSFFFALPFGLIKSLTVLGARALVVARPAGRALRLIVFSPLPSRWSSPAPGTLTASVALPFFVFRFSFPNENVVSKSASASAA